MFSSVCFWRLCLRFVDLTNVSFLVADEGKARRNVGGGTGADAGAQEDEMSGASQEAVDGEVGGVYRQDFLEGVEGGTERLI